MWELVINDRCESYSKETVPILWSDLGLNFKPETKRALEFLFLVQ